LLKELRSLAEARALTAPSPVDSLLITAAELHVRADLGVVDAAEQALDPGRLTALNGRQAVAQPGEDTARPEAG
jgi:hypothetical protein